MNRPPAPLPTTNSFRGILFLVLFGAFLFLLPLKFGNPIVLESASTPPHGALDWFFWMWPNQIALIAALVLLALSFWVDRGGTKSSPRATWLPCIFLATQLAAMPRSVTPQVSLDTVILFAAGLGMYVIGLRQFTGRRELNGLITVLIVSTVIVCFVTIKQYFGGLEETRKYFQLYFAAADANPDYLIKLGGNRPFATFVYPNTLAGFLLLMLPVLVARLWMLRDTWEPSAMWVVLVAVTGLVLFSLVLCGSKGGFLALAVVAAIAVYGIRMPRRFKVALAILIVVCGCGIVARYGSDFVRYGLSTSSARLDYWRAGLRMFSDHPWFGTGPGTFGSVYPKYKLFTSEDPRLAHNDFLEALSDSGVFGFLAYAALWLWPVCVAVRRLKQTTDPMMIGLTLSLVAWVLHGLVDFDQYIPSLALVAFFFLGALEKNLQPASESVSMPVKLKVCGAVVVMLLSLLPISRLAGQFYFDRGRQFSLSNPYAAASAMDRAMSLAPLDGYYHYESARLEFKLGHSNRAFSYLRQASALDPYRSQYVWEMAQMHRDLEGLSSGYFEAAEKAIVLAPKNAGYRKAIIAAYDAIGQHEKSDVHRDALKRIQERKE